LEFKDEIHHPSKLYWYEKNKGKSKSCDKEFYRWMGSKSAVVNENKRTSTDKKRALNHAQ
jgi:hypothetical protein